MNKNKSKIDQQDKLTKQKLQALSDLRLHGSLSTKEMGTVCGGESKQEKEWSAYFMADSIP